MSRLAPVRGRNSAPNPIRANVTGWPLRSRSVRSSPGSISGSRSSQKSCTDWIAGSKRNSSLIGMDRSNQEETEFGKRGGPLGGLLGGLPLPADFASAASCEGSERVQRG